MVFGTTYCAISHLPIEDGDKCILMPLGFNMKYEFNQWEGASINSFMYLYNFIYEHQEVIYNGNPDDITYLNKNYESTLKHELYMLVHFDFFHAIQKEYMIEEECFESISRLPLFKTCEDIWKKAIEFKGEKEEELKFKFSEKKAKNKKIEESEINAFLNIPVPEWIKSIYKIAMFMDGLGMIPYPNHVVDQHKRNNLYEKLRLSCKKTQAKKKAS